VRTLVTKHATERIEFSEFEKLMSGQSFIKRVLENNVVIS